MSISLPREIQINSQSKTKSQITIEPLFPGFGTTIGNALRRVMLSSIPGAAVSSFKIKGVLHEFTSIDHVKEDVVEILLNIKSLRFKVYSDEPVKLTLKVKGEKTVTAADIQPNADVEVVSPDLVILTTTNKAADIEMELTVRKGFAYVPVEERDKEKVEIGEIMVDSLYSPVFNVGFNIENVRVGDKTNYEKLVFDVETDGSITPEEIITQAAKILSDHFDFIKGYFGIEEINQVSESDSDLITEESEDESATETAATKKRGRPKK